MTARRFAQFLMTMVFIVLGILPHGAPPLRASHVVKADGPNATYFPLMMNASCVHPNKIIFDTYGSFIPGISTTSSSIMTINPDGNDARLVLEKETTWSSYIVLYHPRWSPDNCKILFGIGRDSATINPDGSEFQILPNPLPVNAEWSPDGSKVVGEIGVPGLQYISDLLIMNSDGSGTGTNITNTPTVSEQTPVWSPDGKLIAYANNDNPGQSTSLSQIYTIDPSGGNKANISNSAYDDQYPAWSPDGKRIVFVRNLGDTVNVKSEIFTMNADGSDQTQITEYLVTDQRPLASPRFSPDGQKIVFRMIPFYPWESIELSVVDLNGTGLTQIPNTGGAVDPDWH